MLKVCGAPGPTACLKLLHKVCLKRWRKKKKSMTGPGQPRKPVCLKLLHKVCLKSWRKEMTGPGRPRTCSHPINALTLTGVCQAVRMFSPCQFQVYVSIGTLYICVPTSLLVIIGFFFVR